MTSHRSEPAEPHYITVKSKTGKWTVGRFEPVWESDSSTAAAIRTALLNGDASGAAHLYSEPPF